MRLSNALARVSLLALALVLCAGIALAAVGVYPVMSVKKAYVTGDAVPIKVTAATTATDTPKPTFDGTVTIEASTESSAAGFVALGSKYTTGTATGFSFKPVQNTWYRALYEATATAPQMVGVGAKITAVTYKMKKTGPLTCAGSITVTPTPTAKALVRVWKSTTVKKKATWVFYASNEATLNATAKAGTYKFSTTVPLGSKGKYQAIVSYEDALHIKTATKAKSLVR